MTKAAAEAKAAAEVTTNADAEAKAAAENTVTAPVEKSEALAKVLLLADKATAQVKILIPANIRQLCGWDVLI